MIRAHNLLLMKIVRMGQCLRAGAVLCIRNHYKWGLWNASPLSRADVIIFH